MKAVMAKHFPALVQTISLNQIKSVSSPAYHNDRKEQFELELIHVLNFFERVQGLVRLESVLSVQVGVEFDEISS